MQFLRSGLAASVLCAAAFFPGSSCGAARAPGTLSAFGPDTVLLVVSPHPDDETLCCAGVIQRVLAAGGHVSIVWLTSGDGSELGSLLIEKRLFADPGRMRAYGERRMSEARLATARLGVSAAGQLFLGYPDGALSALLNTNRHTPYRAHFTHASAVPYDTAVFPGHPYTGDSLNGDFEALLARVRPTLILAPSPRDSHADHRAAGLLAIAARKPGALILRFWIVHGGEGWPSPRGLVPGIPLTAAPLFAGLDPQPFQLTPAEEDTKLAALRAYDTQMQVMEAFLLSFVRTSELFAARPLPAD